MQPPRSRLCHAVWHGTHGAGCACCNACRSHHLQQQRQRAEYLFYLAAAHRSLHSQRLHQGATRRCPLPAHRPCGANRKAATSSRLLLVAKAVVKHCSRDRGTSTQTLSKPGCTQQYGPVTHATHQRCPLPKQHPQLLLPGSPSSPRVLEHDATSSTTGLWAHVVGPMPAAGMHPAASAHAGGHVAQRMPLVPPAAEQRGDKDGVRRLVPTSTGCTTSCNAQQILHEPSTQAAATA